MEMAGRAVAEGVAGGGASTLREVLGREGWGLGVYSGRPCTSYIHMASDLWPRERTHSKHLLRRPYSAFHICGEGWVPGWKVEQLRGACSSWPDYFLESVFLFCFRLMPTPSHGVVALLPSRCMFAFYFYFF